MLASLSDAGPECVELLLKHKANPNVTDSQKRTALFYAIHSGVEESVKSLLNFGALPQMASVNGKTAFHLASAIGQSDILWVLLNLNKCTAETLVDREGLTPMHWCALKSQPSCLNALLEYAALKTFCGSKITPLHLAAYVFYFYSTPTHPPIHLILTHDSHLIHTIQVVRHPLKFGKCSSTLFLILSICP